MPSVLNCGNMLEIAFCWDTLSVSHHHKSIKTLAAGLNHHWIKSGQPVGFALILAPTRELAQQLASEAEHLGQYKGDEMELRLQVIRLVGGEDIVDQALKLAWRKHHIIVGSQYGCQYLSTGYPLIRICG
ncbi:unnamed protein product [Trichobilharzia regenti]|nr:unnamed protein product [Trichobilharzia regenti]